MGIGSGGGKVGTGFVPIKPDAAGFGADLERQIGRETQGAGGRLGGKASAAFAGAFAAGTATIGKGVLDFAGFDKQMREVFTLLPDITEPAMAEMTDQAKSFASEFGVLPTEVVPALYSSLSAGVPPGNVFEFLETSQMLAKGGVTELETAVDGLSSVVNAYGADVIDAATVSDLMFTAVKGGKTTVDELAGSLFQVVPTASAVGLEFGNVTAALATMTAAGTPTSVATTQLRQLLVELTKSGSGASDMFKELSGQSVQEFLAAGGDLAGVLDIMQQGADDAGVGLQDLFGSVEAGNAALSLTGANTDKFANELEAAAGSAGATQAAFDTMNTGLAATLDRVKARLSVSLIGLGESLAPTIEQLGTGLAELLDIFTALPQPMQTGIVLFGTLAAGALAFAGPMLKVIKLGGAMSKMFTVLAANPWTLAALAIAAAAYLIITNWEDVVAFFEGAWQWITDTAEEVAGFFVETWEAATGFVTEAFDMLGQFFVDWWPLLLGIFTGGIGLVVGLIIQNWDAIWAKTVEIWDLITGKISGAWNSAYATTMDIGGKTVDWITGIPGKIAGAFTTLAETIAAPFREAFNGIKSAWNSTAGGFGFDIPGWIPGVGGKGFTIPSMAAGGVLTGPTLFLGGEYAGASSDPEIVAPQSAMFETVSAALDSAGAGTIVIETHLHVDGMTDEAKFARMLEAASVEIVRVAQRELDRTRRAVGQPRGAFT